MTTEGWLPAEEAGSLIESDDCLWTIYDDRESYPANVTSVETVHFVGPVYNFEVEGAESYVANGLIVHNCRCGTISVPPGTTVTHDGTLVASR